MQTPQHYIHELLLHVLSQEDDHYPAATASTLFIREVQHQCWIIRSVSQAAFQFIPKGQASLISREKKRFQRKPHSVNVNVFFFIFMTVYVVDSH